MIHNQISSLKDQNITFIFILHIDSIYDHVIDFLPHQFVATKVCAFLNNIRETCVITYNCCKFLVKNPCKLHNLLCGSHAK
jgi:hypothetical protein